MPTLRDETVLIHNARIYTMDHDLPYAGAMLVRDGRVVGVGKTEEIERIGGESRRIDAEGHAIIPGLVDAHIHLLAYARSLRRVDLDGLQSKEQALARVVARARDIPAGEWVLGGAWNNNLWTPNHYPTKYDLDRVAPDNPVCLDRKDLHSCWVNSMALQRAGITRDTPDPAGAAIGRDEAGEPNGMLFESATQLVHRAIDEEPEAAIEALRRGFGVLARMGLTGFHDCEGPDAFSALQELDALGELPLRAVILLAYNRLDDAIQVGLRTGFGSEYLRAGPVKIFSDGSLGSMTAEMLRPYEGHPDRTGIGTIGQSEMEEAIVRAAAAGIPSAVHAIGDAANRRVLDAFERAREVEKPRADGPLVHRIEHAQLLQPDDIPRFSALGVVASMQPTHATSDMLVAERLWGERARYSYAWRSVLESGALLAFGSDAPVETPNPFVGIHAAVTRQDAQGNPPGGWYPQERLTVGEAVRAYTEGAARSAPYLPGVTGTLSPGSAADFLLLDRDIFEVDPAQIREAKPLATVVGGKAVYDPDGLFL